MRRALVAAAVAVVAVAMGAGATAAWHAVSAASIEAMPTAAPSAPARSPSPLPIVTPSSQIPVPTPSPTASAPAFSKHTYLLDTPVSPWVVINKTRPLEPQDYVPPELVPLASLPGGADQHLIPEAASSLVALHAAAQAQGAGFRISTAYRSYNQQAGIYNSYVRDWGRTRAETYTARPGYSEHQMGRAVDIYTTSTCKLKACFADTVAAQFVAQHGHEYGFIIRYPEGKDAVTGYRHEPWHLRWVGVDLATEMYAHGPYTMEEFFDLPPAPDYPD